MTRRIPHGESPLEIRKGFQRMAKQTDVITDGPVGAVLVGAGSGTTPIWGTDLTTLTLLTVDDITINGAVISSGTGAISFSNENLTTTGSVSGINVTSGLNPGHSHSGGSLIIDHGADLTGLGDDDHGLYHTDARGDVRYYTKTELNAGQLDTRYFTEAEHLNTSAGAADAGKPIKLDAAGHVDATMINDGDIDHASIANTHNLTTDIDHASITNTHNLTTDIDHASITNTHNLTTDIDHGAISGLGDVADHPDYSLTDGTRDFSGVVVGIDPVNSNQLATKEYVDSAISFIQEFFLTDTASVGSYFSMVDQHTGEAESNDPTGSIDQSNGQALTEWITVVNVPGMTGLEHGIYSIHIHIEKTGGGARDVVVYFEVYIRTHPGGSETLVTTSEVSDLITSRTSINLHAVLSNDITTNDTDRLVVKLFANGVSAGNDATIVLYSEGATASHFGVPTSSEVLSTIFLRQDGTKDLTGDLAVDPGITIDGRDIRLDGMDLDTLVTLIGKMKVDTSATADYLGAAFNDGVLRTSTGIS